jgi:hypothetical protein
LRNPRRSSRSPPKSRGADLDAELALLLIR